MPKLSTELIVEAPADAIWDVIARRFDRIGEWATAIPTSTAVAATTETAAAPAPDPLPGQANLDAPSHHMLDSPVPGHGLRII